ncbi:hypothetical protein ES703_23317 [subsurface metagenome]
MTDEPKCNICRQMVKIFYELKKYPVYVRPVKKEALEKVPVLPIKIGYCANCNHIIQIDPPVNAIDEVYKTFYETYHSTAISGIGCEYASSFASFLCKEISGKNLLEIGCSDGYFLRLMQKKRWNVWGCDPSPRTSIAREKFNIAVKKELFSKDLFDQKFDCIVMRNMLEHCVDPKGFLSQISTSLIRDGYVAIEIPNVLHTLELGVVGDFHHEHISYFTPQSLACLLNKTGYDIIRIAECGYAIYLIAQYGGDNRLGIIHVKEAKESRTKRLIGKYTAKLERLKKELMTMQEQWVLNNYTTYLYGAGGHTMGLLSKIPLRVKAIIDKDESKQGKYLPGLGDVPIRPFNLLETLTKKDVVLISSEMFQDEIIKDLQLYINKGLQIIKLYPHCECVKKQ